MRNGGFWFKVKVLSFKIRFCNGDSDAHLTPTTAHAQTLCVMYEKMEFVAIKETIEENEEFLTHPDVKDNVYQTIEFYKKVGFILPWIGYCVKKENIIVGMAGFKGQPVDGKVEISYGTNEQFRQKGIGTEICKSMVELSKRTNPEIIITARTLPETNYSTRILEKCGFEFQGTTNDKDDGDVWEWKYINTHTHNKK